GQDPVCWHTDNQNVYREAVCKAAVELGGLVSMVISSAALFREYMGTCLATGVVKPKEVEDVRDGQSQKPPEGLAVCDEKCWWKVHGPQEEYDVMWCGVKERWPVHYGPRIHLPAPVPHEGTWEIGEPNTTPVNFKKHKRTPVQATGKARKKVSAPAASSSRRVAKVIASSGSTSNRKQASAKQTPPPLPKPAKVYVDIDNEDETGATDHDDGADNEAGSGDNEAGSGDNEAGSGDNEDGGNQGGSGKHKGKQPTHRSKCRQRPSDVLPPSPESPFGVGQGWTPDNEAFGLDLKKALHVLSVGVGQDPQAVLEHLSACCTWMYCTKKFSPQASKTPHSIGSFGSEFNQNAAKAYRDGGYDPRRVQLGPSRRRMDSAGYLGVTGPSATSTWPGSLRTGALVLSITVPKRPNGGARPEALGRSVSTPTTVTTDGVRQAAAAAEPPVRARQRV
ncbi:hypothetical protein FISHEDRAFT_59856, partial [Fistulina hepatica ATCC 64428]